MTDATAPARQRAPKGANPETLSLVVPEGWTGKDGRLAAAAAKDGEPSAAEWVRKVLDAAMARLEGTL